MRGDHGCTYLIRLSKSQLWFSTGLKTGVWKPENNEIPAWRPYCKILGSKLPKCNWLSIKQETTTTGVIHLGKWDWSRLHEIIRTSEELTCHINAEMTQAVCQTLQSPWVWKTHSHTPELSWREHQVHYSYSIINLPLHKHKYTLNTTWHTQNHIDPRTPVHSEIK